MKKVRVLVTDDSALMRKLIPQMLAADESIDVVGTAMDGSFCLKKIEELKPNVVTLDLEMPGLSGSDTLKAVMRKHQIPVIVVSSHTTAGASVTLQALALGAFDFVAKPQDVSAQMPDIASELIGKIKAAALSKRIKFQPLTEDLKKIAKLAAGPDQEPTRVIAIGQDGVAAVTNRRIAKEAGVSLGSVTYHFETQHELLRESLLHFTSRGVMNIEGMGEALVSRLLETKTIRSTADTTAPSSVAKYVFGAMRADISTAFARGERYR